GHRHRGHRHRPVPAPDGARRPRWAGRRSARHSHQGPGAPGTAEGATVPIRRARRATRRV
ncbi:MAG: hypothetical protein AVDCRST_MAG49-3773, partial [uncultured Thermomicrobiales bacterium]